MISKFEDFPDELILMICRRLKNFEVVQSFGSLNSRLDRTISWYYLNWKLKVANIACMKDILSKIGGKIQQLEIEIIAPDPLVMKLLKNVEELTLNGSEPRHLQNLTNLVDLIILHKPRLSSINFLKDELKNLNSVYIDDSSLISFEARSSIRCLSVKQISLSLNTFEDLFKLCSALPNLTFLNVQLKQMGDIEVRVVDRNALTKNLRTFSLRTIFPVRLNHENLMKIFSLITNELEQIFLEISVDEPDLNEGETWKMLFEEMFPKLKSVEFVIDGHFYPTERLLKLPEASLSKTFSNEFWQRLAPQGVTEIHYRTLPGFAPILQTNPIPKVFRKKFFFD